MPPKPKDIKTPQTSRPPIDGSSLVFIPEDVIEGFQERIETGIDWTLLQEATLHHKKRGTRPDISPLTFSYALKDRIKKSFLHGFLDKDCTLTLDEQWELLPLKLYDNELQTEEGKICFRSVNSLTDGLLPMIHNTVRYNDRDLLKKDLKLVYVLRLNDAKMTGLDRGLKRYKNLITLNLCGNYLAKLQSSYLPLNLRILELRSNAIHDVNDVVDGLPSQLLYLGLANNFLTNDTIAALSRVPRYITVLDLSDNDIYDMDFVLRATSSLHRLGSLMLIGNPCSCCAAYARTLIAAMPQLQWLDNREILETDRLTEIWNPHPDDMRSAYFTFSIHRIMSIPQPPKVEKGITQGFHVELELPLLDKVRRKFLMFRNNASLTEMLPVPEDDSDVRTATESGLADQSTDKSGAIDEALSEETDIYERLVPVNPFEIINFTIFESPKFSWNKYIPFSSPTLRIFCPDLVALRNTFRTIITLKLVYTQVTAHTTVSKAAVKSSKSLHTAAKHSGTGSEYRVVLATMKCPLRAPDWSQPLQDFHWDDSFTSPDAMHWGEGDLGVTEKLGINYLLHNFGESGDDWDNPIVRQVLSYTMTQPKSRPSRDVDIMRPVVPEILTMHVGFGIETIKTGMPTK